MKILSVVRAVLVASLAALPSSLIFIGYEGSITDYFGWAWTAVFIFVVAAVGCVVLGLPIHYMLQKKNVQSRLVYLIIGFLTPIVIMAAGPIIFMDWKELINKSNIEMTLVLAVAGAAVAVTLREMLKQ